jgi:16S rRNA C967 or C1407 C5-methylase (RsmB/RsmF family)
MEGPGESADLPHRAAEAPPCRTYSPDIEWDPEVKQYLEAAFGAAKLAAMSAALARPPLATCLRVNTLRTTPEVRRPVQLRCTRAAPA